MDKDVKYTRIFYDICENERQVENWLVKHGGTEGKDYHIEYRGNYYIMGGMDQHVLTVGDVIIEIYNPMVAFHFELFKVGGRLRDRTNPTNVEVEWDYEYIDEHPSDDKPVYLDKYQI